MRRVFSRIVATVLLCLVSSNGVVAENITLAGTGDGQEVFEVLAKAYEAAQPGTTIHVPLSIDSGGGIRATAADQCQVGRVARPPKKKEEKYGLTYRVVAYSPVVFAVHPSVEGVDNITLAQINQILSGALVSWKALGGPDAKIYVVQREKGDSGREVLRKSVPGFKKVPSLTGYVAYSADETLNAIRNHPYTIGYVALQAAEAEALKVLKVEGVYPTAKAVKQGKYPLKLTLGLVWKDTPKGLARSFIDFCFGPRAKAALSAAGAIPAQ